MVAQRKLGMVRAAAGAKKSEPIDAGVGVTRTRIERFLYLIREAPEGSGMGPSSPEASGRIVRQRQFIVDKSQSLGNFS